MSADRTSVPLSSPLFPPLPDPLPAAERPIPAASDAESKASLLFPPLFRSLKCGCYLVNFTPVGHALVSYDGTMRVECHDDGRTASGDLYQRPLILLPHPFPKLAQLLSKPPKLVLAPAPNPKDGIPIFSRSRYRYYLRVTQILEGITFGNSFQLGFERWRFDLATRTWTNEGTFTAQMTWSLAPLGFPSKRDYLVGDVRNGANAVVGRLTMGWISKYLRRATVEIDRVGLSE
jgi:hypothetical protein